MAKSKFFRVAVAGATASDGRVIEPAWIDQMAANYNPATYGARVNLEHIKGYDPKSTFKAYGDVLALKVETVDIEINGKTEKRKALYAQIDPTDDLIKLNKDRQKIYTSIEVATDFANTGKAGLVGLAATDNPASLGTEMLAFSTKPEGAFMKATFDARKQAPTNLFSSAIETSFELEPESTSEAADAGGQFAEFLKTVMSKFAGASPAGGGASAPQTLATTVASPGGGGEAEGGQVAVLLKGLEALGKDAAADRKAFTDALGKVTESVTALQTKLDTTEAPNQGGGGRRQLSTGGAGQQLAEF